MENYVPDIYQKSIYEINYQKLFDIGIKCLLFDLDNTLVPYNIKEPNEKISELFNNLKNMGFRIIIFSNSGKKRLKIFKDSLEVDCCARAMKPFPSKFLTVLDEYKYNINEVAIIGDQLLTDIKGGNRVGITTIFINPISKKDHVPTKINRFIEGKIIKKLSKKDVFYRGKYYD
ncbi:MAG: YqeG family HAD IIIA-type phosphatase [Bacilli bacterium]|nr:YqeG family HAD IIIA-type phosphatase [Bacilli bacterium]